MSMTLQSQRIVKQGSYRTAVRVVERPRGARNIGVLASSAVDPAAKTQSLKALKEWHVSCLALADGRQTVLFRKGGIKDKGFKLEAKDFLLFPTSVHTTADQLQPDVLETYSKEMEFDPKQLQSIPLHLHATVTGAWSSSSERLVSELADLHIWTDAVLHTRLAWRPNQPITVLELRCARLQPPIALPSHPDLFGCFSWVDLSGKVAQHDVHAQQPVLAADAFARKQELLRSKLQRLDATPLL